MTILDTATASDQSLGKSTLVHVLIAGENIFIYNA